MTVEIKAIVLDDETILLNGQTLLGKMKLPTLSSWRWKTIQASFLS